MRNCRGIIKIINPSPKQPLFWFKNKMDHNMRKNSYEIVLSRIWKTEGGNFLLGTRRVKKVSCFMVDVPLSSIIAGSVLAGHVIREGTT